MKKLLITELQTLENHIAFRFSLTESGIEKISGGNSIISQETEELNNIEFRKLCDNDIEVFIDGTSIGFGALHGRAGMAPGEVEKTAATPEAD